MTPTGDSELLFQQGLQAYGRGDAAGAETAFRTLVERGHEGPDVLYNLGTSALAQGKVGDAIYFLELARRGGGGADVEANLAIARGRQLDQLVGAVGEETFVERVAIATSATTAGGLFAALWGLAFLLLAARVLLGRWRLWLTGGAAAALVLSAPAAAVLGAHLWTAEAVREGVVLAHTLAVHEVPEARSRVAFELHPGVKLRMLDRSGDFVRVRLPNGLEGWTDPAGVSPLR
jgi:hypothetical protein